MDLIRTVAILLVLVFLALIGSIVTLIIRGLTGRPLEQYSPQQLGSWLVILVSVGIFSVALVEAATIIGDEILRASLK